MYIPNRYSDFSKTSFSIFETENESTSPNNGKKIEPNAIGIEKYRILFITVNVLSL